MNVPLMNGNIKSGNKNPFELSKVRIIGIRIIGRILHVISIDCLGKKGFVGINRMFEL